MLSTFKNKFPNVDINIKIGQAAELKDLLKQNKLDIIYISDDDAVDPALNCCLKKEEELVFTASVSHPLASVKNVSAKMIFDYSFIVTEPAGYCYRQLNKISTSNECFLHHNVIIDSVAAIKSLLLKSDYIAFLPKYSLSDAFERKELAIISTSLPSEYYYSQVLCTKNKWLSPLITELISEIQKSYN